MIANPYFDNFWIVSDFKKNKIVVNKTEQIYIKENSAIELAVERVKGSVAVINGAKTGIRSGLIISADGLLATVASSVPTENYEVFLGGESVNSIMKKSDSKTGIIFLKADKNDLQTTGFSDYGKIKLGQKIFLLYAVSQKQDHWRVNEGIIREIGEKEIKTTIFEEKNAAGAPIFNSAGEFVGLSYLDSDGRVSAVPANEIRALLGL